MKNALAKQFEIKELGKLHYFLIERQFYKMMNVNLYCAARSLGKLKIMHVWTKSCMSQLEV